MIGRKRQLMGTDDEYTEQDLMDFLIDDPESEYTDFGDEEF